MTGSIVRIKKGRLAARLMPVLALLLTLGSLTAVALAAPGDLLGTVDLPGNGSCSVAGTFDGTFYITVNTSGCTGDTLGIYEPPAGGNGVATLVSTKPVVDGDGNPVTISAVAWDPSRERLWGAANDQVWEIDIGDPTVSGDATATFRFNPGVGGSGLVDGLAYDGGDDTLFYSPDVNQNVYHFSLPDGTLLNTVTPKNAAGDADGLVSGVVVGSQNTLYIARDGAAEIRRIDKTTGDFISDFATTSGRVEDLTCDPVTYAPNEAVLSKDAFNSLYEAFEVEPGTCPLVGEPEPEIAGRMNGGGSINLETTGERVATHGFELHCIATETPNNLEVNWDGGNRFHLEELVSARCSDDPDIDEGRPVAGFDTYEGEGNGRFNGESGATIEFTFTDAGEPGRDDRATIVITNANGDEVLNVSGSLVRGNHQAHPE